MKWHLITLLFLSFSILGFTQPGWAGSHASNDRLTDQPDRYTTVADEVSSSQDIILPAYPLPMTMRNIQCAMDRMNLQMNTLKVALDAVDSDHYFKSIYHQMN